MQVNYDARKVVHRIHDVPDVIIGYRCFPRIFVVRNSSSIFFKNNTYPEKNLASKYALKMNKRHTRTRCELLSKLASKKNIKTTSFGCLYC